MLYVNFSDKPLEYAIKWPISYFQPILAAIFVTIATVKVEAIRDFYTLVIVLINSKLVKNNFLYFSLIGGQNSLLMHVPRLIIPFIMNFR